MRKLAAALVVLFSCTKSDFFVPPVVLEGAEDNRLEVSGSFCAEGAENLAAYLKIMFIVDRSNSMLETDPNNRRLAALEEVVRQFIDNPVTLELRDGVQIALVSFAGSTDTHTLNALGLPGFTKDGGKVLTALARLAQVNSLTGYDKALGTAFQLLDSDMARLEDAARERSRYEVFFVSDGSPDPCAANSNDPPSAVRAVERIVGLAPLHGVPLTFHTAFVSTPGMFTFELNNGNDQGGAKRCCLGVDRPPLSMVGDCDDDPVNAGEVTRAILREMAEAGGGTFKQFENGDSINFLDFEFAEARRLFALSYFMASNLNAVPAMDRVLADSDADGLTD
ncbi:MAG: VWA domain-containing protein, partial [Deltaproteobacteria bacterium]|nr:VWA domain-containing protein [Deltaproteobacteria bacterium]